MLGSGKADAATNDGSWRRIACSNATSSGPGSRPSSSTSIRRAWCKVRNASPWRPAWYWAVASSAHRRSRSGAAATRVGDLGQHLDVLPGAQRSIESHVLGLQPQLLQPAGLDPPGVPVLEVDEAPGRATNASASSMV